MKPAASQAVSNRQGLTEMCLIALQMRCKVFIGEAFARRFSEFLEMKRRRSPGQPEKPLGFRPCGASV